MADYGTIRVDNLESLRSTHRLARLKPGKFRSMCQTKWGMRPVGRTLFRGSCRAFPGPQTNCGRGLRPLSFAVNGAGQKEKLVGADLEQLTQRLCGNRDGVAVGERIYFFTPAAHVQLTPSRRNGRIMRFCNSTTRKRLAPSIRLRNQPKGKRSKKTR